LSSPYSLFSIIGAIAIETYNGMKIVMISYFVNYNIAKDLENK